MSFENRSFAKGQAKGACTGGIDNAAVAKPKREAADGIGTSIPALLKRRTAGTADQLMMLEASAPLHAELASLFLRCFDNVGLQLNLRTRTVKAVDQSKDAGLFGRRSLNDERIVVLVDFNDGILVARNKARQAVLERSSIGIADVHDLHHHVARMSGRLVLLGKLVIERE